MNCWGDTLRNYGLLIELDSRCDNPIHENELKIEMAKLYFEMGLEKYRKTDDIQRIMKCVSHFFIQINIETKID
jgi:hypothetical protein